MDDPTPATLICQWCEAAPNIAGNMINSHFVVVVVVAVQYFVVKVSLRHSSGARNSNSNKFHHPPQFWALTTQAQPVLTSGTTRKTATTTANNLPGENISKKTSHSPTHTQFVMVLLKALFGALNDNNTINNKKANGSRAAGHLSARTCLIKI